MSTVGAPDYQRVNHGFVASVVVAPAFHTVAANSGAVVPIAYPIAPDVILVSVSCPALGQVSVETININGDPERSKQVGAMGNSDGFFSIPIRSLGGSDSLNLTNGAAVARDFGVGVQGFIGVTFEELVPRQSFIDGLETVVGAGAASPTFAPPGSGRFTDLNYYGLADQAYTMFIDYLEWRSTGSIIRSVSLGAAAAGVPTVGHVFIPTAAIGAHIVNNGAVNATVIIKATAEGTGR